MAVALELAPSMRMCMASIPNQPKLGRFYIKEKSKISSFLDLLLLEIVKKIQNKLYINFKFYA